MSVSDLTCRATTCYLNNYQWVTYCESLHLHLWPIQLPSQAKWRAQWLWNVIGGGRPCVERETLLPSSIKSLGFWVYTQQTASTLSVNIWEKEKVCLVWGCLRFSFLWLRRCPQFPVSVCQSGVRSESRLLLLGYQRGQSIATVTKPKARCFKSPQSLLSQNLLWNIVVGTSTGQIQASFSTSCLSMTCSNIKWLFHSNCLSYYSY